VSAAAAIDGKNPNAVVTPVRPIDDAAGGRYSDLGTGVAAGIARWDGRHDLDRLQSAGLWVEAVGGDTRTEFIDHVRQRHLRMKGNVVRAGTRACGNEGWMVRRRFPACRVGAKHKNSVEPFVEHGDEPAARFEDRSMRMRAGPRLAIWARLAGQVNHIAAWTQGSVLLDRHQQIDEYASRLTFIV
jgi:hypothetical protein